MRLHRTEAGWFVALIRAGRADARIAGPFTTREAAQRALDALAALTKETNE